MTTAADSATEKAFEAVLAGRAVPPGTPGLGAMTAFTEAVRATATQPGRPSAALAELLASGLLVDQPSPSARTAKRRRRRMWFFSAILAKIAGASAVAQAATGAGIVLVGFTGAGAAGVLPSPVQHTFATVVSSVTPLTAPDPSAAADTTAPTDTTSPTDTSTTAATSTEATDSTDATQAAAPADKPAGFDCDLTQPFGACVSEHAKDGTLPAGGVSAWAQYYQAHRGEQQDAEQSAATESPDGTDSAATLSAVPQRTQSGSHHGNSGHGNSGHGNSGRGNGHGDH
jgi:hypothetical protein